MRRRDREPPRPGVKREEGAKTALGGGTSRDRKRQGEISRNRRATLSATALGALRREARLSGRLGVKSSTGSDTSVSSVDRDDAERPTVSQENRALAPEGGTGYIPPHPLQRSELPNPARCPVRDCLQCFEGDRRMQNLTAHLNKVHPAHNIDEVTLIRHGLCICQRCGSFVSGSISGRQGHEKRCPIMGQPAPPSTRNSQNLDLAPPSFHFLAEASTTDRDWMTSRPRTLKSIHATQFAEWTATIAQIMRGYTLSSKDARWERQLHLLDAVRTHLKRPTRKKRPEDKEKEQQLKAQRENEKDDETPSTVSMSSSHKRVLQYLELGALGKAARALGQPPTERFLAKDAKGKLEALHPYEDPTRLPRPETISPTFAVQPVVIVSKSLRVEPSPEIE